MRTGTWLFLTMVLAGGLLANGAYTITVEPGDSIQAAIDTAPEGAVVCMGEGVWEENLLITTNLTLRGQGPGRTVLRARETDRPVVWISPSPWRQLVEVSVEELTVTGARGSFDRSAILVEEDARATIVTCNISGNEWGVGLWGMARATLVNCTISQNSSYGIWILEDARATIINTDISQNECAIWLTHSAQVTISECTIADNSFTGIQLEASSRAAVTESSISGSEVGIWLVDSAEADISNCRIFGNSWYGVWIVASAKALISGSEVLENTDVGVSAEDVSRVRNVSSTISRNGVGLQVKGSADAVIMDCTISHSRGSGILLGDSAQCLIKENRVFKNEQYGVALLESPCFDSGVFSGHVSGSGNTIPSLGQDQANQLGGVCPSPGLDFLTTSEGGEADRR